MLVDPTKVYIGSLGLPNRTWECLTRGTHAIQKTWGTVIPRDFSDWPKDSCENLKILTVAHLIKLKEAELQRIHAFGRKSLEELKEKLDVLELKLGMGDPLPKIDTTKIETAYRLDHKLAPYSKNRRRKLTQEQVDSIRKEYLEETLNQTQLAKKYNVSNSYIHKIISHDCWTQR